MKELTHINDKGEIRMVSVTNKHASIRKAIAKGFIFLNQQCLNQITNQSIAKGDVIALARVAAINAVKKTSEIIILSHNINIDSVEIDISILNEGIEITTMVNSIGKTGVELEALNAVTAGLLNIYDMCKSIDNKIIISDIKLISKSKQMLQYE